MPWEGLITTPALRNQPVSSCECSLTCNVAWILMSLSFKTATMAASLCLVRVPQMCCTDGDPRESSSYMLIWMPEPMGLCSVCSIL